MFIIKSIEGVKAIALHTGKICFKHSAVSDHNQQLCVKTVVCVCVWKLVVIFSLFVCICVCYYLCQCAGASWCSLTADTVLGGVQTENSSLKKKPVRGCLVGGCCFRYHWGDEIWSRRASLSNISMSLKGYETLKHYTVFYNAVRKDFTPLESHRVGYNFIFNLDNCKVNSNVPPKCQLYHKTRT